MSEESCFSFGDDIGARTDWLKKRMRKRSGKTILAELGTPSQNDDVAQNGLHCKVC